MNNLKRGISAEYTDHLGRPRVVITGMGAITPLGHDLPTTWENLLEGKSGAGPIKSLDPSKYPCQIAAELKNFDPLNYFSPKKARHMPTSAQLAVATARQAIEYAGLELSDIQSETSGVIMGTAGGNSIEETEHAMKQLFNDQRRLSPYHVLRVWPNMPSYFVAAEYNLKGYNSTVCTACAAGTQAIADATRVIQRGDAALMIAGGSDHMVSETVLAGFTSMRALAVSYNDAPERAMRPFDAAREGFIVAGGAASVVLERADFAVARGANILCEILGAGISNDAFHMIAPDPDGKGAALAMGRALADAGVDLDEVDYINAHAASTPLGDLAETKAIKSIYKSSAYSIPISSTKSMIGHLMGAAGALEAVVCVMTIQDGVIHPTINYENPDEQCDLDYVPNVARETAVKIAMSNSFGLGGQNACLVFGQFSKS